MGLMMACQTLCGGIPDSRTDTLPDTTYQRWELRGKSVPCWATRTPYGLLIRQHCRHAPISTRKHHPLSLLLWRPLHYRPLSGTHLVHFTPIIIWHLWLTLLLKLLVQELPSILCSKVSNGKSAEEGWSDFCKHKQ